MNLSDLTASYISDIVLVWKKKIKLGINAQSLRFFVFVT